jgi:HAD superfamily hydrolase (TIGR01509 family)
VGDPNEPDRLAAIFASTRVVLLDFDGPVCDVFAGLPARDIAEQLRDLLTAPPDGLDQLPDDVIATDDPLHIVRRVIDIAPERFAAVDIALRAAELTAIAGAEATPGAVEFLRNCHATGRRVAIVSNNSAEAVAAYLERHDLTELVDHVQGRDPVDLHRMKPDPAPLRAALAALDASPQSAALIGDSLSDIEASRAAGVHAIAYANKPTKTERLAAADTVITDMNQLAQSTSLPNAAQVGTLPSRPVGDQGPASRARRAARAALGRRSRRATRGWRP